MHDAQFYTLVDRLGFSRKGYRKVRKGVKKRIGRHMRELGCSKLADYLERLQADPVEMDRCKLLMTVSISRFFRDKTLWTALEEEIAPELIRTNPEGIRAWSAGCACGEEVYSMKIVWERLRRKQKNLPAFDVAATDLNPVYLQKAQAGIYPVSSLKEVEDSDLESFFRPAPGGRFEVLPVLRAGVRWQPKDHLTDPPETSFQLIFMRNNVLTYLEDSLKRKAFENVAGGLAPSGILVIGSHEELPEERAGLVPVEPFSCVFRRKARPVHNSQLTIHNSQF